MMTARAAVVTFYDLDPQGLESVVNLNFLGTSSDRVARGFCAPWASAQISESDLDCGRERERVETSSLIG
jgi:hypothetical protein